MTQRASYETKRAYLSTDFGRDYALRTFSLTLEQLEKLVGRYTKGKRKGELRGCVVWGVVTVGGWVRDAYSDRGGFVVRPGLRYGHGIVDSWTGKLFLGIDLEKDGHASAMKGLNSVHLAEQVEAEAAERQARAAKWKDEYVEIVEALRCAGLDGFEAYETAIDELGSLPA